MVTPRTRLSPKREIDRRRLAGLYRHRFRLPLHLRMPDCHLVRAGRHALDLELPGGVRRGDVRVLQDHDESFHFRVNHAELRVDAWELRALREDVVLRRARRPGAPVSYTHLTL